MRIKVSKSQKSLEQEQKLERIATLEKSENTDDHRKLKTASRECILP